MSDLFRLCEILPGRLWQTSQVAAWWELSGRHQKGPWLVIGCVEHPDPEPPVACKVHFPFDDGPLPDLDTLSRIGEFGAGWILEDRPVLVHCDAGRNRSALVCAEILWWMNGGDGEAIYQTIKQANPEAFTNETFAAYVRGLPPGGADRGHSV